MPTQNVVELKQRSWPDVDGDTVSRTLGFFTDKSMAEQALWACYREAWKAVHSKDYVPDEWFPAVLKDEIKLLGFDTWSVNDHNSAFPIFYTVKHQVWNQVPASLEGFRFSMKGSD